MDDILFVEVLECEEKLFDDLNNLFFFEGAKFIFEGEERILCEFHDEVEVRFVAVEVVQFDDVVVFDAAEELDFPEEVLLYFLGVLFGD